jgi:hypothetical protein
MARRRSGVVVRAVSKDRKQPPRHGLGAGFVLRDALRDAIRFQGAMEPLGPDFVGVAVADQCPVAVFKSAPGPTGSTSPMGKVARSFREQLASARGQIVIRTH